MILNLSELRERVEDAREYLENDDDRRNVWTKFDELLQVATTLLKIAEEYERSGQ